MRTLIRKKIGLMVQWLACKPSKLAVRVQFPVKSHFLIFLFYFFFSFSFVILNLILISIESFNNSNLLHFPQCLNAIINAIKGKAILTKHLFLLLHTYLAGFPCDQACKGTKLDDASIAQKQVGRVLLTNI